jgi:hypothetical protein
VTMDDDVTMIFNFLFYFAKSTPICGWLETLLVLGRARELRRGIGRGGHVVSLARLLCRRGEANPGPKALQVTGNYWNRVKLGICRK